jgi:hypothetical protein
MSKKGVPHKSAALSLVDAKDIPFSGDDFQGLCASNFYALKQRQNFKKFVFCLTPRPVLFCAVLNQFCFACFHKFNKNELAAAPVTPAAPAATPAATATASTDGAAASDGGATSPTAAVVDGKFPCGLKCGAVFCNRGCYQKFLTTRARQHGEVCKETHSARQLLNAVESSRKGKPTREQVGLCCNEMVHISQRFDDEDAKPAALPSNKPKLSSPDLLLARLLLCRIAFMIGDEDNLCTLLLNTSDSLRDAAALNDIALLYARKAATIVKRKRGEKRQDRRGTRCFSNVEITTTYDRCFRLVKRSADFAKALHTIGVSLEALNRFAEAKELFEREAQLAETMWGKNSKQQ